MEPGADLLEFTAATRAVVAAALLAGLRPAPEDPRCAVAPLPSGMLTELAADAVTALERAHSPGSDLWEQWCEAGGYDRVWSELTPALRTLRAVGEPDQDRLF
ncbi:DUF4259 domain-containing protein [Planomonospora venezuelensis]|uniref:DUF4259 domain-containing protein n=1 Tax=Planomonospora venezuelensis TaxID=1999 RepID=UPI001ACD805B|nr:hypothetical protein Pve01_46350 [Planomonospora venezuelensis]